MTCPGSLPSDYASLGVSPAVIQSRVTSFPPAQQLTKLCEAAGCACQVSGLIACWPFGSPFYMYYRQHCSIEWCYCFNNQENMMPIEPAPVHPNVAANNRAPANIANAPPISHHRKQQAPGAACAGWNDCAGENYVCKIPNSARGQSQPQSGTCTWLANAAAAVVASSALGTGCQRGRCLSAANSSDSVPPNPQPTIDAKDVYACACNCTYASQACCSTTDGIVNEDATQKVSTISPPPGTFCNVTSGDMQSVANWAGSNNNTGFSVGLWGR